jgi:hypothetical protein
MNDSPRSPRSFRLSIGSKKTAPHALARGRKINEQHGDFLAGCNDGMDTLACHSRVVVARPVDRGLMEAIQLDAIYSPNQLIAPADTFDFGIPCKISGLDDGMMLIARLRVVPIEGPNAVVRSLVASAPSLERTRPQYCGLARSEPSHEDSLPRRAAAVA